MSYAHRSPPFLGLAPLYLACAIAIGCVPKPAVRAPAPRPTVPVVVQPDPRAVTLEGAPGHRFVPSGTRGRMFVRLRIGTTDLPLRTRPRINLALVMDTSGSMDGKAMTDAIAAGLALLDALKPGDRLAVVTFGSEARVVVPSTVLDEESAALIREQIEALIPSGTTDMAAGLGAGLEQVYAHVDGEGVNRVVLLGDGIPNDEGPILPMAQAAGQRGVSITALGLGVEYNETLMAAVAQSSGGRFHYIAESDAIATVFVDEVLRLARTVARDLTLSVRAGPGVRVTRIFGHPNTMYVQLGTLAQGETRDVMVELDVPARKDDVAIELLDADLVFQDAVQTAGTLRRHVYVATRASADVAAIAGGEDGDVLRSAARQALAAAVLDAIALARQGRLAEARAALDAAEAAARGAARARPDPELDEAIASLAELRSSLPSLVQPQVIDPGLQGQRAPEPAYDAPIPAAAPSIIRTSHEDAIRSVNGP